MPCPSAFPNFDAIPEWMLRRAGVFRDFPNSKAPPSFAKNAKEGRGAPFSFCLMLFFVFPS